LKKINGMSIHPERSKETAVPINALKFLQQFLLGFLVVTRGFTAKNRGLMSKVYYKKT